MSRARRSRSAVLAAVATAVVTAAPVAPASAMPTDNSRDVPSARTPQLTVIHDGRLDWPVALLGAGTGGALIAVVVAAAERRRRPEPPPESAAACRRTQ